MIAFSTTLESISADGARCVLDAAVRRATELSAPATVAVVDVNGALVALLRMDGAPLIGADLARMKAATSIGMGGVDTAKVAGALKEAPTVMSALAALPGVALLAGAGPVRRGDRVVGAVGVSSTSGAQDGPILEAALGAVGD